MLSRQRAITAESPLCWKTSILNLETTGRIILKTIGFKYKILGHFLDYRLQMKLSLLYKIPNLGIETLEIYLQGGSRIICPKMIMEAL